MRKIDELGRIVIPKDIRSALKLKLGDTVEVAAEGDFVTIKKSSRLKKLSETAELAARIIEEELGVLCVISDLDEVIAVSDGRLSYLLGSELSEVGARLIDGRKELEESSEELFAKDVGEPLSFASAIAAYGEAHGIVAIYSKESSEKCVAAAKLAARILAELA